MRPSILRRALPASLVVLSLALTGCGGGDDGGKESNGGDTPTAASETPAPPATWPLTGELTEGGADPARKHPAYIVKIDNSSASDPQIGVGKADLVVEELVEGGITRLAVFFYENLPQQVGPVRSMRLTDVGIAKPLGATIVTSGAAPVTLNGLRKAGIKFLDMNNPHVVRVNDGVHDSLHSVMADLKKIGASARGTATRPDDYLPFGETPLPAGAPATTMDVQLSGGRTSHWKYDGTKYVLQNGYMADGDVFKPDTVIAATVRTSLAPYRDPAGNPVPVSHFEGKGKAVIFHGGQAVDVTWEKADEGAELTFTDAAGNEIEIPAGRTWLELVPGKGAASTGSVTYR
ncbi:DUF3048 domain-containing protein [Nocardioides daeguensis]|uniref:DUF3048 domain-containing protein n=1 Tax=Nocardioides daeguensis TaxID=908359 RepID=A0ABP6W8V9_9ACTN|nr:DUF3048 domain-containing protein [Nocardioides daeguensis]MBV6729263.1 DUF3048 domain-containing protein [Nocardioides daeguensis]MCR1774239.1 DUF3048 domain-containing protein [Nocardioides daeguensis]